MPKKRYVTLNSPLHSGESEPFSETTESDDAQHYIDPSSPSDEKKPKSKKRQNQAKEKKFPISRNLCQSEAAWRIQKDGS
jgi:hypothetical protein